jgi:Arc/MetJ-type ribon-helix-helix transcriptional regulator
MVRRSVDLSPNHHAKLGEWVQRGRRSNRFSRVTGQDVFRALVARLLTDETLAHKIRADLADDLHNC